MITSLLATLFGSNNERQLKRIRPLVDKINALEAKIQPLSDDDLKNKTLKFREQLSQGKTLDDILPEAFAVVREASFRSIGQRHHDVQLLGGIILHEGKIAEMKTGEGKTLTATLPLYLNALSGKSVFLVTTNDYLARRDSEWMAPIFEFLGLTVSCLQHSINDSERKNVYAADIVYATNNELGFDYLRDNMKFNLENYVQREHYYAIVDEVDSILIDEARTPLIISGQSSDSSSMYVDANKAIARLHKETDYEIDEKQRTVLLTEQGTDKVEAFFKLENLYAIENLNTLHHINQALRAHALFKRDIEYVVKDGEVLIVDEFTGRVLSGRRYSDGLHQAIEAKEGVIIEKESQTLASITLQNFFRMFEKLAGMTGTAMTEAEEFYNIYKLEPVSIPTNRPMIREDKHDIIFLNEKTKFNAIVQDIKERYIKGQPVLIGTIAVETSERLSKLLTAHNVIHEVLNAKQHAREAEIVERAGQKGQITIATNMAGRGTDIKLSAETLALGGLYILGTERHESRRIDNQLRGRAGRQGDAGESRFYISLEDNLIRIFAKDTLYNQAKSWGMKDDEVIEDSMVSKVIEYAQEKVEKHNFEIRKHLLEYDDVMNQHRKVIYKYRRSILEGSDQIHELVNDMIMGLIKDIVNVISFDDAITDADAQEALSQIAKFANSDIAYLAKQKFNTNSTALFVESLSSFFIEQYALSLANSNANETIQNAVKWIMLETVDQAWKQHMLNLDHLKEGINLRSWGQKNPLIEYKKESFAMFKEMMEQIRRDIVFHIFHLNIDRFDASALEHKHQHELDSLDLISSSDTADDNTVKHNSPQVGRNDECPCGSHKKYKKCCGK